MQDYQSIFTSKTFWGAAVAFLASAAPIAFSWLGLSTDPSSQAAVVAHIIAAASFAFTVYGRFKANHPVSLTGAAPTPVAPKL